MVYLLCFFGITFLLFISFYFIFIFVFILVPESKKRDGFLGYPLPTPLKIKTLKRKYFECKKGKGKGRVCEKGQERRGEREIGEIGEVVGVSRLWILDDMWDGFGYIRT